MQILEKRMKEMQWKSKSFPIGQISDAPSEQDQSQVIFLKPAKEETALKVHQIEGVVMGTHPRFDKLLTEQQDNASKKQEQEEVQEDAEQESVTEKHMLVVKGIRNKTIKRSFNTAIDARKVNNKLSKVKAAPKY